MDPGELVGKVNEIKSSPESLAKLITEVGSKLHSSRYIKYRPPGFYEVREYSRLYVLGDLHGDYEALLEFLYKSSILDKFEEGSLLLFLGDYIDRGAEQVETITFILLLKSLFTDNVILLRGNHEPPPHLLPYPHDFPYVLSLRYGGRAGSLYTMFMQLFQRLAYAARIPRKVMFLHGGPPTAVLGAKSLEEAFSIGQLCADDKVLEDVLWSDPAEYIEEPYVESPRGAGSLYGEELTRRLLKLADVKYVVRGHEAVDGYKVNHSGRVITIFSSKYTYGLRRAGYLVLEKERGLDEILYSINFF